MILKGIYMLGIQDFPIFLAAAVALNLFPGPDTLYIATYSMSHGRRAGLVSVLGISTGVMLHAAAAALGLSVLLAQSALAFSVLKWLGAAYLIFIGLRLMLTRPAATGLESVPASSVRRIFRQAVLTNLLNPKVALFFLALLPQFVDPTSAHRELALLVLGGIFVATGMLWFTTLALATAALRIAVRPGSGLFALAQRIGGGVFIALGARLATEQSA